MDAHKEFQLEYKNAQITDKKHSIGQTHNF
jgi:hypothetical protein